MEQFGIQFAKNHAILCDIDSKRSVSRCFEGHNLHHRVTDFVETFFPSLNLSLIRPV